MLFQPGATGPLSADRPSRRLIAAWCFYDWGNSAFTTLVVTFIYATYFSQHLAPSVEAGTVLWSRAISASGVLIALGAPLLGSLADRTGRRRRWLAVATLVCVAATSGLTFVAPTMANATLLALVLFTLANLAFELGMVFYNAFLVEIAPAAFLGRVSGYGWGLGYGGGIVCLLLALVMIREPGLFHLPTTAGLHIRATNLLAAGWFLLFSLPFLLLAPAGRRSSPTPASSPLARLRQTLARLQGHPSLLWFLLAHLLYNDGLVTIFAFGGIYAAGTFGLTIQEVVLFGIVLNLAAGLGSLLFGFVDDWLGPRPTILLTLAGLIAATLAAACAGSRTGFWAAGLVIGLLVGPNQSASRSLMARLSPAGQQAEYFGLYTLSGKMTSFLGPLLLGMATDLFNSQRAGVASVLLFLAGGGLLFLLGPAGTDGKRAP